MFDNNPLDKTVYQVREIETDQAEVYDALGEFMGYFYLDNPVIRLIRNV